MKTFERIFQQFRSEFCSDIQLTLPKSIPKTPYSIISDDTPMVCQHLKHVTKTVWNRGLVETLEQLFVVSEDLVAGPELHSQLLQAQY